MTSTQITRLKKLFELSLTLSGDPIEIFQHAAKMIGELLEVKIVCLSEIKGEQLNFLAVYVDGEICSNAGSCPLAITPCATVEQSRDFRVYDRVRELFPEATFLQKFNAYAYCGFPSLDNDGKVVAVTCLLDDKPHDFTNEDQEILRIIGQRIGMEIERKHNLEAKEQISIALRINEDRLNQAIRVSGTGIFDQNHCNNSMYCSPELRALFGWSDNELVTTETFVASIYPEDQQRVFEAIQHAHNPSGNGLLYIDYRILCRNGEVRWLATRAQTFFEAVGDVYLAVRTVGAVRDITEKKLAEQEQRLFATAFQTQEGIIITDANQIIVRVNQAFTNITGYPAHEAIGNKPSILKSGRHDSFFYRAMHRALDEEGYWQGEIWDRHKNGRIYPKWLTITAVKDSIDQTTHYVANFSDITQHKKAKAEIHRLAYYDPLTELPNRRLLLDRLGQILSASTRNKLYGAVLFMDMDNFKTLNDTRGHEAGDRLLVEVAQRLKTVVRECDTLARLGGDEFVLLLEDLDADIEVAASLAKQVSEKVLGALAQPYNINEVQFHCTVSIGISVFCGSETIEELLKQSDLAMYQVKTSGRNGFRFFDPAMQDSISARVSIENDLRYALEQKQFKLHFQMQADHNRRIIGAEVLLRWEHPERGLVSPLEFIYLAEENGLILPIGQWVLETACTQLKRWETSEHNQHLQLAVNVSPSQFHQAEFVEQINQMIQNHAINPNRLKLEITENMLINNIDDIIIKMQELKKIGVQFSIDDFGTGFSSLAYLTQLPLNQLKIDQSFVRNIGIKPSDAVIVQTIIGMANNLDMEVIAEGVETEQQRDFLERNGCLHYQGYLFGKPVPIEQLEDQLRATE